MALPSLTLTGTITDASGTPLRGTLTFQPNAQLSYTGSPETDVPQEPVPVTLSNNGTFTVSLLPCDAANISPTGWAYVVNQTTGYPNGSRVSVPAYQVQPTGTGTIQFSSLTKNPLPAPSAQLYVPLNGGTMTGPLVLSGDPTTALGAATKEYVDAKAAGDVTSWNGRTGAVTPQSGDYTYSQVGADAAGAAAAALASAETYTNSAISPLAPLASPALTGSPTAPTQTMGDSSTKIATDAFVVNTAVTKGSLVYNVRDYGAVGNGTANDATACQAAITAAATSGGTVYFPPGTYLVNTALVPANNVAVVGAGVGNTVIEPGNAVAAFNSTGGSFSSGSPLTRFSISHLTIDGTQQGSTYNVAYKGVFCQFLSECSFTDLVIQNCIATGLGIDFLTNGTVADNVRAINNGRGAGNAGCAGIGIGTGAYAVEDFVVSNCFASGNHTYGIFTELQYPTYTTPSKGARFIGCYAVSNGYSGFSDAGCNGAQFAGCVAMSNTLDGFAIDSGTVGSSSPGGNTIYTNCEATSNTRFGFSYVPTSGHQNTAGPGNLQYIGCKAVSNGSVGFALESSASYPLAGALLAGCLAYSNGGAGVEAITAMTNLTVTGCQFRANGQTSGSSKNAIMLAGNVTRCWILGNQCWDDGGTQKQGYGLYIGAGVTVTTAYIQGNDFRGNLSGAVFRGGTLSGAVFSNNEGDFAVGNFWTPSSSGLIAATGDIGTLPSQAAITTGRLFVSPVLVDQPLTANGFSIAYTTLPSATVTGGTYLIVYSSTGTLLGETLDFSGSFTTTASGVFLTPQLISPITGLLAGQTIYLGIINNYTGTGPTFVSTRVFGTNYSGGSGGPNVTGAVPRLYVSAATYTTVPSPMPAISASNTNSMVGIGLTQ